MDELAATGAEVVDSPLAVAQASDLVFTNLPNSSDVESIVLGSEGVLARIRPGMVFADNSTIKPESARMIAKPWLPKGRKHSTRRSQGVMLA